jgi:prepilin-type N-terminal cleavage/methylation domain-containing protein
MTYPHPLRQRRELFAFTLIELLVVIAIIVVISSIALPALRNIAKSNDQGQATSLLRGVISSARANALSQHRMAGVVFFEESTQYSQPVHRSRTAVQLIVEAYDQSSFAPGTIGCEYFSAARQYLPEGVKLAALTDNPTINVETGDTGARVILFDANGELVLRGGLVTLPPSGPPGAYPMAYGDWRLVGTINSRSSPGFFLYNKVEYDNQPDDQKINWLKRNSTVILVNANTGGVLR